MAYILALEQAQASAAQGMARNQEALLAREILHQQQWHGRRVRRRARRAFQGASDEGRMFRIQVAEHFIDLSTQRKEES